MKATIKPDFLLHDIAGEKVLIGGGKQINFSKLLILNDTAVGIITELQKRPATSEELAQQLTKAYDIAYEEVLNDTEGLLLQLEELGVVMLTE